MIFRTLALLCALAVPAGADVMSDALQLASRERARLGLPALRESRQLAAVAETQARHMARRGEVSHRGANGTRLQHRIRSSGYKACFGAENVAAGLRSSQEVTQGWMGSPGHRKNILDPRVREGAVAAVRDGNGRVWWAMVLATPC